MMNTDRGDLLNSELFGSLNPAMACQDSTGFINQDGAQKPKILDTFLELCNLTLAVHARISRIRFQIFDRNPSDGGW